MKKPIGDYLLPMSDARKGLAVAGPRDRRIEPRYALAAAARYVGVPSSTLTTWARGYTRRFPDRPTIRRGPLIHSVDGRRGEPSVSFLGLTEAMVVAAFRHAGLPMQRIRPAVERLQQEIGLEYALASKRLYSDGAEILFDYAKEADDDEIGALTVVRSRQTVFKPAVQDYLKRLEFDHDQWAMRIYLPITSEKLIAVDPTRGLGQPLFVHGGAPLNSVMSRLRAGDSVPTVAADFDLDATEVRAVRKALAAA